MTGDAAAGEVRVKICGITRVEDALLAADLGAAALGFIFWEGSPRFIDPYRARQIVLGLPPLVTPVGVFVSPALEYVKGVAGLVRLGAVQLHGEIPSSHYAAIEHRVIRALPVTGSHDEETVRDVPGHVTLLLDAHDPVRVGGTGRTIDWRVAARIARQRRIFLSGGLSARNVEQAVRDVRPYAVDVSSGVEERPGIKSPDRLAAFFAAVRRSSADVLRG